MTHDEVIAWIDKEIAIQRQYLDSSFYLDKKPHEIQLSAWLAIQDVLGLHCASSEPDNYETIGCVACGYNSEYGQYLQKFPCPTYQGIYNRIREVM